MTRNGDDVWITGIGAATPLGNSYSAIADNLMEGRSGIRQVAAFDVNAHPSKIAGWFEPLPCPPGWNADAFDKLARRQQLGLWCCVNALRDSGWWDRRAEVRVGIVLGAGAEWLLAWEEDGLKGVRSLWEPQNACESVVQVMLRELNLTGPGITVSAACASGNHALAQARRWLELDWVDVCLAGAGEYSVSPMSLAAFGNLRALSRRNAEPAAASRPFDKDRDGFVVSDGGAMFVLEPAARARGRGAHAYAKVAGCGASSDAYHMVIPSPDPEPASAAMRSALADAEVDPGDVDYVNAHATSTPVGDVGEARVLHAVFGEKVKSVPVSSTKSMTGHLLTAAAAVEALACVAAIERQAVPPTINLNEPDPACDLCHVPHHAQQRRVKTAVSNSFGFGGSNTCLVLTAV